MIEVLEINETMEIKAEITVDDSGLVTGIAWPFGAPDSIGDLIEPTAFHFTKSVPMIIEHDQRQVVGKWNTYSVTATGLEVKGELFVDGIEPARVARRAMKAGTMSGLSIGYRLNEFKARPEGGRTLTDLTIREISLCRSPVHTGARVTEIKSVIEKDIIVTPEELAAQAAATLATETAAAEKAASALEIKALVTRLDKVEAKSNRITAANDNNATDEKGERKAFVSYLRRGIERISPDEVKALTVSVDGNGGYLAPDEIGSELLKLLVEYSPIRAYAKVVNISADNITYPRRLTGTAATWVAETDDRTATGMTFEQVKLTPFELATYCDVSNQLLEDNSYGLEGELLSDFAETFGKTEGLAFVKGTGVTQPKGILTAAGIKSIKTGVAASFPTTNPADVIIGMYGSIPTTHAQNGVWLMNRNTITAIRQWKDGTGRYLVLDPITAGGATTLLGRPIVEMLDMPDIGAGTYPIVFGDMTGFRIVDRIGVSTLRDPYSLATKGQVRFHARKRVGSDVTHPDRFVKLQVAA